METRILPDDFDSIRPYRDDEVTPVLKSLLGDSNFIRAIDYAFPGNSQLICDQLTRISTIGDFQSKIISAVVRRIIQHSISDIRISGLDFFPQNTPCLIISNHRDIILDSALLNYELFLNGYPTTRIAIGNNLLQEKWIEQLVRLNKNFIVHRNVHVRQAYEYSMRLSAYILKSLREERESVWIAQREGRTKNGDDRTQAGLLKMLALSAENEGPSAYADMKILPLTISYEKEPCAGMKAYEMFCREKNNHYQKAPGEDLISMKAGIEKPKGRVNLAFSEIISPGEILACFRNNKRNESLKELAVLIDRRIIGSFMLYPIHYYACDKLRGNPTYQRFYSEEDVADCEEYFREELSEFGEKNHVEKHLLLIYANPVIRKEEAGFLPN